MDDYPNRSLRRSVDEGQITKEMIDGGPSKVPPGLTSYEWEQVLRMRLADSLIQQYNQGLEDAAREVESWATGLSKGGEEMKTVAASIRRKFKERPANAN